MKISYGLTVCDEHKEIRDLIKYLLPLIDSEDEIVIVYDKNRITPEVESVLEDHKEEISYYEFDFQQNFLENKNFMNSKCTGDYIFQIDADEIPSETLVKNLKTILQSNPVDLLMTPRKNLVEGLTKEHIKKWGWTVNNRGWVNWPDIQKRIYKNTPEIKWKGHQVHGMVEGYKTFAALPLEEHFCIRHYKTINRQESQNNRYSKIEKEKVKVVGITRVRNEEEIIQYTLDHVSKLVDEIYVYDDCSTDNTVSICKAHPKVVKVIEGKTWESSSDGRQAAEGVLRQKIYEECLKGNPDWVYYFDSDEFAYFDDIDLTDQNVDAYFLRLFDYYITEEDIDSHFLDRKYLGPEYRDIMMLFRPTPHIVFTGRQPSGFGSRVKQAGYVKHYGKAISIEEWEKTCDYYINHRGGSKRLDFTNKWKARKGKAVHTRSDFGYELIEWEQRKDPNCIVDNSHGQVEHN